MAMGISRNTPNYIWKLKARRRSMEVEMRRRTNKYILEVCEMKEGRWPKICLKEELRGIINGQPSQWGAKVKEAIEEVGSGTLMDLMYDFIRGKGNNETVKRLLEEGNERKMEQDTQGDWVKVDKSTYCGFYKEIKKGVEIEKYWDESKYTGLTKEQWARLRCGNIGKVEKKGYANWNCRVCEEVEESMEHIWKCETAREQIKEEWVRGVDEWKMDRQGNVFLLKLINTLNNEPKKELCEYVRAFENLASKRAEANRGVEAEDKDVR